MVGSGQFVPLSCDTSIERAPLLPSRVVVEGETVLFRFRLFAVTLLVRARVRAR